VVQAFLAIPEDEWMTIHRKVMQDVMARSQARF
jgi:hypothetical protein